MENEIENLENRLTLLLEAHHQNMKNNRQLRRRIIELEAENDMLNTKVKTAIARVEAILSKLPEGIDDDK